MARLDGMAFTQWHYNSNNSTAVFIQNTAEARNLRAHINKTRRERKKKEKREREREREGEREREKKSVKIYFTMFCTKSSFRTIKIQSTYIINSAIK